MNSNNLTLQIPEGNVSVTQETLCDHPSAQMIELQRLEMRSKSDVDDAEITGMLLQVLKQLDRRRLSTADIETTVSILQRILHRAKKRMFNQQLIERILNRVTNFK